MESEHGKSSVLRTLDKYLDVFEMAAATLTLCAMTIMVLLAVVLRYVMQIPNMSGEEISRYLFVTIVYIGISMCVRERKHIGVTIFVEKIPAAVRGIAMVTADIITTLTMFFISVLGWLYVITSLKRPQFSVATGMPMVIIYTVVAVGLTLSALRFLMLFWSDYLTKTHPLGAPKAGDAS